MSNLHYLFLGKKVDKSQNIIATFRVESSLLLKEAAGEIAAESSIGTWTNIRTMNKNIFNNLSAKVFEVKENSKNKKKGIIKVAYPLALFELGNIPQLLSSVAGNIFSMKIIKNLRLENLEFPEKYVKSFKGPRWGIEGVRKISGVKNRPLLGSIIKPKMGLSSQRHSEVAYECFIGGVDLVKDDENLTSQDFNLFRDRVRKTLKLAKKAEDKTSSKKICAFNVTAETFEMIKRAEFIKKSGGNCAMIDIITVGFGAVQSLRKANTGLIIHGHRAMHSVMTRNPKHGISMLVIAKLARLAGIDQLHTGTVVGKMEGEKKDILEINNFLTGKLFGLKPVLPIASGGLYPRLVPELVKILGKNIIINFGGGIHGHPRGTLSGAKAARQAVNAAMKKISLKEYAEKNKELKEALENWK